MSKLREQLVAHCTNRYIAEPMRKIEINAVTRKPRDATAAYALEYVLSMSFVARGYAKNDHEKELLVKSAINSICNELFGEFRTPLIELESALWERDFEAALNILRSIREAMFS